MKQGDKNHYSFGKYGYPERWASYYHQIKEILTLNPASMLFVGVGDGVVSEYLKRNTGISVKTLDINPELKPDIVCSVDSIPCEDGAFDLVACFEVLEHLEFGRLGASLSELTRVSNKHILLSLPHFGPPIKFSAKIPFLPEIKFFAKVPYPQAHMGGGEHFWEIGKKGYPQNKIREIISSRMEIDKEYIPSETPYHHFFVAHKK